VTDARAEVVAAAGERVAMELRWREPGRRGPGHLWQVLTLRGGRVVDIQDYRRQRQALRAVLRAA
jgi:hypothetical protein